MLVGQSIPATLVLQPDLGGEADEVLEALRGVDPERTTPLEALELLARMNASLTGGDGR